MALFRVVAALYGRLKDMKPSHKQLNRVGMTLLVVLVLALIASGPSVAEGCSADISGEFRHANEGTDQKIYIYKADVTTPEVCAHVKFNLWVRQVDGDGKSSEQTEAFEIQASSRETKSRKVNYVVPLDTEVMDWRFKVVDCTPCDG